MNTNLALIMSLLGLIYAQPLFSARMGSLEYRWIPVEISAQLKHEQEILGMRSGTSQMWRTQNMHEIVHVQIERNLAPEHQKLASKMTSAVLKASLQFEMDPLFLLAMIKTESGFDPNVRGSHGEIGLMQILPQTAQWMAVRSGIRWLGAEALKDPEYNIRLGVSYLSFLRGHFKNAGLDYVSAYNMGPKNVRRLRAKSVAPTIYASKIVQHYKNMHKRVAAVISQSQELKVSLAN